MDRGHWSLVTDSQVWSARVAGVVNEVQVSSSKSLVSSVEGRGTELPGLPLLDESGGVHWKGIDLFHRG